MVMSESDLAVIDETEESRAIWIIEHGIIEP